MLQRFLLLWLVALSALAYWWPEALVDPFLATRDFGLLRPVFAVAMFCIGGLLPREELRQLRSRWSTVLGGTAIQYTVMPLLAYAAAHAFQLGPELTVGVILVGCVPGAMASNVLTLASRGNVSYSVSLTTSATLLSPLVVPIVLQLALGAEYHRDPLDDVLFLLKIVVGPVIGGHLLSRRFVGFERVMKTAGPVVANLAILWIIATVVGINRERLGQITGLVLGALLLVNLLGYAAGYLGGWAMQLPESMKRALTLEVGMQNAGLGAVMATELFKDRPDAAIPPAAYTFGCMLTGTVLATWWGRRMARTDDRAKPQATH